MANSSLWKVASELNVLPEEAKFEPLQAIGLNRVFSKGITRGQILEVHGKRSSGRLSICFHILAEATRGGEICAVVDLNGRFDPASAEAAEVRLEKIVWVRCGGNAEHAMRATDLLLHAGGFGIVLLDLCQASLRVLNRMPVSYWHRFRRAIENTSTILVLCTDTPQVKSGPRNSVQMKVKAFHWSGKGPFLLLRSLETYMLQRKVAAIRPEPLLLETTA